LYSFGCIVFHFCISNRSVTRVAMIQNTTVETPQTIPTSPDAKMLWIDVDSLPLKLIGYQLLGAYHNSTESHGLLISVDLQELSSIAVELFEHDSKVLRCLFSTLAACFRVDVCWRPSTQTFLESDLLMLVGSVTADCQLLCPVMTFWLSDYSLEIFF
jgi:hypothetical protein